MNLCECHMYISYLLTVQPRQYGNTKQNNIKEKSERFNHKHAEGSEWTPSFILMFSFCLVLHEDFNTLYCIVVLYCIVTIRDTWQQEVLRAILDDLRPKSQHSCWDFTLLQGKMRMMRVFRVEVLFAALSAIVPPPSEELVKVALCVVITVLESEWLVA